MTYYDNFELQWALRLCDYADLDIDGIYGPQTMEAVRSAQEYYGIEQDGEYGPLTDAYLSEEVRAIQKKMQLMGYYKGDIDMIVGALTDGAVRTFQADNGLTVDAMVGTETLSKIAEECRYNEFILPNFEPNEFKCECGCGGDVLYPLKQKIQHIREATGEPVIVTSGFRCPTQNARDGGVPDSLHMAGRAVDFYIPGMDIDRIAELCHENRLTVGYYYNSGFIHGQIGSTDFMGD